MTRSLPGGLAVVWCVAALGLGVTPAHAETADVSATSLMSLRQEPRDGQMVTVAPAFLFFNLSGQDIRNPVFDELDMVLSSWGRMDPGQPRDGRLLTGDVNLAYMKARLLKDRITLRGGRHFIYSGAARATSLDGVSGTALVLGGLGASAYAGMPVRSFFEIVPYDFVGGSRVFYRHSINAEVGASFTHLMSNGRMQRQDVALDGRWTVHRTFTVNAFMLWSTANATSNVRAQLPDQRQAVDDVAEAVREIPDTSVQRPPWLNGAGGTLSRMWPMLAEGDFSATWQPIYPVQVSAHYRRQSPDLFLSQNSIFTVFSRQRRDEVGTTVYLRPARRLSLSGDYYLVDNSGESGHRGGLRGTVHLSSIRPTNVSTELRMLTLPSNGYVQGRLYGLTWITPDLLSTLDTDVYVFHKPINGQRLSYTTTATLGWAFLPGWQAVVSGAAGSTPWVEYRVETMFKLVYSFSARLREGRTS